MKSLLPALAIVAMFCTGFVALCAVVFIASMGANSSPTEIRNLKLWMGGLSLLSLAGIVVGIILMRASEHGWASVAAILPSVVILIVFIVSLLRG